MTHYHQFMHFVLQRLSAHGYWFRRADIHRQIETARSAYKEAFNRGVILEKEDPCDLAMDYVNYMFGEIPIRPEWLGSEFQP